MKKIYLFLILALLSLLGSGNLSAASFDYQRVEESLRAELAQAKTPDDSLHILYDIFDIVPRGKKRTVGNEIYLLAKRMGHADQSLDILRLIAGLSTEDDTFNRLRQKAKSLPASKERDETDLFIKLKQTTHNSRDWDYARQEKAMAELSEKMKANPDRQYNPVKHAGDLFAVVCFLRNDPTSSVLVEYVDSLVAIAKSGVFKEYYIPNLILNEAANIYTDAGLHEKSIQADRRLLGVINGLQAKYKKEGRKYRNYSVNRFISYRRMLRSYKALRPGEADQLYSAILELASKDMEVNYELNNRHSVKPYYFMAKGRYKDAIPEIRARLETEKAQPVRLQLLSMLRDAGEALGDSAVVIEAMTQQNDLLSLMSRHSTDKRYKELQTAYGLMQLRTKNQALQLRMAENEAEGLRRSMTLMIILWVVVLLFLILIFFYWSKYRAHSLHLNAFMQRLQNQRDALKKEHYSDYDDTSNDAGRARGKSGRLRKNSRHVDELLQDAVADLLYISAIGRNDREKHIAPVRISSILDCTRDDASRRLAAEDRPYNLDIKNPADNVKMVTDDECLCYILSHIVVFASNASPEGNMSLEVRIDEKSKDVRFIFAHDGPRIPRGNEEDLFKDIVNFDDLSKVRDSALFLSRLSAFLLRCRISYNPRSEGDAQLFFTVPMNFTD